MKWRRRLLGGGREGLTVDHRNGCDSAGLWTRSRWWEMNDTEQLPTGSSWESHVAGWLLCRIPTGLAAHGISAYASGHVSRKHLCGSSSKPRDLIFALETKSQRCEPAKPGSAHDPQGAGTDERERRSEAKKRPSPEAQSMRWASWWSW